MPKVSELQQGINILDADAARGMVAAYREGDDVVYVETRIGALKPAIYREDPNEPANEVDMMIVDKNGIPFYMQRGGDQYVDSTWANKIELGKHAKLPANWDRNHDFALAQKLGLAIDKVAEPSMAMSTYHIHNVGMQLTPDKDPGLVAAMAKIKSTPLPTTGVDQAYWSGGGWWYPLGRLYSKCVALCAGHHSSVANWEQANGTNYFQTVEIYCNHGTCAQASGISWECDHYSQWNNNPYQTGELGSSTSANNGGCYTSYNWWGGNNTHLCNDDSAYELFEIKEGKWQTSHGDNYYFYWNNGNGEFSCSQGHGRWASPGCGE
ncbi:MAG: hypothetical protein JO257_13940 [Deltaproteobacteria bacterium]|nr:hypothetical protein [Deltaproteobacteria bacterium]